MGFGYWLDIINASTAASPVRCVAFWRLTSKQKTIKTLIIILTFFLGDTISAQNENGLPSKNLAFHFYYGMSGLGSGFGSFMPTLRINNDSFTYTKEQNSYFIGHRSEKKDTISVGLFQQSSIDSILFITRKLKDKNVKRSNPCISLSSVVSMIVAYGTDTTTFSFINNTLDSSAFEIITIINNCLPIGKKLPGSKKDIDKDVECNASLPKISRQKNSDSLEANH